jgi:hypothetical protein
MWPTAVQRGFKAANQEATTAPGMLAAATKAFGMPRKLSKSPTEPTGDKTRPGE